MIRGVLDGGIVRRRGCARIARRTRFPESRVTRKKVSKNCSAVSKLWIFPPLRPMILGSTPGKQGEPGTPASYEFELGPMVVVQGGY
jgi:hypothetical protein